MTEPETNVPVDAPPGEGGGAARVTDPAPTETEEAGSDVIRAPATSGEEAARENEDGWNPGLGLPAAEAAEVDAEILNEFPFLPDYYNETYLYLVPRDTKTALVVWEVGEGTRRHLRETYGEDFFDHNHLVMRVCQVTGVAYDGFNANHTFEVEDWLDDKTNYWISLDGGNDYVVDLGYRARGTGYFEQVARSNTIHVPKAFDETAETYSDWGEVRVDGNPVEVPVGDEEWRFNLYHYWRERTHAAPPEKGCWALVLHQHLPFVRHPEYEVSLEEQWFFEAVVAVYTQFLHMLWRLERDKIDFRLTVSLTPSLLSMMRDPLLRKRASRHIDECIALATKERDNSHGQPYHDTVQQTLHRFWLAREVFDAYEGDLTRGYRDFQDLGKLEVITCPATHMILPLYAHFPEAIRAQLGVAVRQYEETFGRAPRGVWLPENAYTPGIEGHLAAFGLQWFLVDARGINRGDTRAFYGTAAPVVTHAGPACFGIDEDTRTQVWSRQAGYPGHPNYKEWYRDLGYDADWDYLPGYFKTANVRRNTGLKYFRITSRDGQLHEKDYYRPLWAEGTVHEQAGQFVYHRGAQANHLRDALGITPCVVSAYDAELFGHWWEEGPSWLESVFRKMCCDQQEVRPVTPSEFLAEHPRHQRMTPGASSWGKKNDFRTWVDGREYQPNCWIYRHMYRLCGRMTDMANRYAESAAGEVERALDQAARELFLAISSDWGFLIETGQAVRYSELRIIRHADRARELLRQVEADAINPTYLRTLEAADTIFAGETMDFRVFRTP